MKLYKLDNETLEYKEYNTNKKKSILLLLVTTCFVVLSFHNPSRIEVIEKTKTVVVTEFDTTPLTLQNVWDFINEIGILHPKVVYQQMVLETGNFTSDICKENNNIVGQRVEATNIDGSYRYPHYNIKKITNRGHLVFANWKLSLLHYKEFQNYNYLTKDWNYYNFLKQLGYAEAPDYILQLKKINTP